MLLHCVNKVINLLKILILSIEKNDEFMSLIKSDIKFLTFSK